MDQAGDTEHWGCTDTYPEHWEKRRLEDPSSLCTHLTLKHPTSTRRLADHMMSSCKRYYVYVM